MSNQRAKGTKLLTLPASGDFIKVLDKNLRLAGYSNRSQFIRDAITEKLESSGIEVPGFLSMPDQRAGKGGQQSSAAAALNDTPASSENKIPEDQEVSYHKRKRKPGPK